MTTEAPILVERASEVVMKIGELYRSGRIKGYCIMTPAQMHANATVAVHTIVKPEVTAVDLQREAQGRLSGFHHFGIVIHENRAAGDATARQNQSRPPVATIVCLMKGEDLELAS